MGVYDLGGQTMGGLRRLTLATCLLVTTGPALAATEAEKAAAIDKGLEWLAQQQQSNGRWEYGGETAYDTAATGAALLAFLDEGWKAGDDVTFGGNSYGDVVGEGLTYLLSQAQTYTISAQTAGNPDSDGNGVGLKFVAGANNTRDTYVTGIVLPAIAKSGTPDALVTTGPLATRTDGTGAGGRWTYRDVVRNGVDYYAYGQSDSGTDRGGWRYYANYGDSDNSTAQWPPIAMLFATEMGVSAPGFVKDELAHWIGYIQNPTNGGSGYDHPNGGTVAISESKTGGLLVEMMFAGDDTSGTAYNLSHPKVLAALDYLDDNWRDTQSGTWFGNFGNPYAMWSIYKGLETTIGLADTTHITNLNLQGTAQIDAGDTWNWYEDYCQWLVSHQNTSGSWTGYDYWTGPLATAWNINILNATRVPTEVVPLPPTALAGAGLLGALAALRAMRRRRRTI